MTRQSHIAGRLAFTLTEVMVSLLILALAIFSATGFLVWLVRAGAFAEQMTTGTVLAQQTLEDAFARRYDDIQSGTDTRDRYTREWVVTSNAAMKTIEVTVSWTNSSGARRQVSAETAIAR